VNGRRYLLDNNALTKLTRAQRSGPFVLEFCRIPTEVLYEATGLPGQCALGELEYKTTAEVLEFLRKVMATVPPGDFKLVDLRSNKGAADPVLVAAAALHAMDEEAQRLLQDEWVIVTDEQAVARKAAEYGIDTLTAPEARLSAASWAPMWSWI
jgi:hypothetical protein